MTLLVEPRETEGGIVRLFPEATSPKPNGPTLRELARVDGPAIRVLLDLDKGEARVVRMEPHPDTTPVHSRLAKDLGEGVTNWLQHQWREERNRDASGPHVRFIEIDWRVRGDLQGKRDRQKAVEKALRRICIEQCWNDMVLWGRADKTVTLWYAVVMSIYATGGDSRKLFHIEPPHEIITWDGSVPLAFSSRETEEWVPEKIGEWVRARIQERTQNAAEEFLAALPEEQRRLITTIDSAVRREDKLPSLPESKVEALLSVYSRHAEAIRGLVLAKLGLDEKSLMVLVSADNHAEVRVRFAKARQHLGLEALQTPFQEYQVAIGAFGKDERTGWSKDVKREMASRLNAIATALGAVFEQDGQLGLLDVTGAGNGTFQLRLRVAGRKDPPHGLGQAIGALRLRAHAEKK